MILRILFLLIPFSTLAQEERYFENRTESFEELEIELIPKWENQPDSLSSNFELGALYWEHAKYDIITPELISSGKVSQEIVDSNRSINTCNLIACLIPLGTRCIKQ